MPNQVTLPWIGDLFPCKNCGYYKEDHEEETRKCYFGPTTLEHKPFDYGSRTMLEIDKALHRLSRMFLDSLPSDSDTVHRRDMRRAAESALKRLCQHGTTANLYVSPLRDSSKIKACVVCEALMPEELNRPPDGRIEKVEL